MNVDFSQGALDSFNMGKEAGTANSPVSGIGMAIRGMLQDARAKGLLKTQSLYQTEGADKLAQLKEGREEERRGLPAQTIFAGATPAQDRIVDHTRGDTVKAQAKVSPLEQLIAGTLSGNIDFNNVQDTLTTGGTDFKTVEELDAAKERGDVKVGDKVTVGGVSGTVQ